MKFTEKMEHTDLEAPTGGPLQKSYNNIFKKVKHSMINKNNENNYTNNSLSLRV